MLTTYRRHLAACPHKDKGSKWKKCSCPIWVTGRLPTGKYIKESLNISSWEGAQFKVRQMETDDLLPTPQESKEITIDYAVTRFLTDAQHRKLSDETVKKLRQVTDQLKTFCTSKGFSTIRHLDDPDVIAEFRETWKDNDISALKKFERLRSFFRFCLGRKWI